VLQNRFSTPKNHEWDFDKKNGKTVEAKFTKNITPE